MFILISTLFLIIILSLLIYLKFIKNYDFNKFSKLIKILSIIYVCISFVNLFLPDGLAREYSEAELKNKKAIYENIIRWLQNSAFLIIPTIAFFNNKILNKIASYIVLPFNIIYMFSYNVIIKSLTDPAGRGLNTIRFMSNEAKAFMINETFRTIIFILVIYLALFILLIQTFKNINDLKFSKKEIKNFILVSLGIIVLSMPCYAPQYLIGYTNIIFKRFTLSHLAIIILLVIETIFIYNVFKNKPKEIKIILLILMSLSLLFQFNQVFTGTNEINFKKFPFQLCNIGSYLILITLITKNKHLFNFCIVVNVVGATIAMIILDVNNVGIGYYWNIHYILEHGKVIIIPILCLLFKIFEPLTKKDVKDVLIGFSSYFTFVLLFGTIANGIYHHLDNSYFKVNFLFMFLKEETTEIVGFVEPLFDIKIKLGIFELYPIIQLLVFIIFTLLCVGCFYLLYALSNKKKELNTN